MFTLVVNPEDRFSRDEAHIILVNYGKSSRRSGQTVQTRIRQLLMEKSN